MPQILTNILSKIEQKAEAVNQIHMKDSIRGLGTFINDIRGCRSREAEQKRINKELANIRSKFRSEKNIDGYRRKKYIAKLIFMHMLGYDINFGYYEAALLLNSTKLSEKHIGYLFISMMFNADDEQLLQVVTNSLIADLRSHNHLFVMLAAHCIPNIIIVVSSKELANEVRQLLTTQNITNDFILQALLSCYLALIKQDRDFFLQSKVTNEHIIRLFPTVNGILLLPIAHILFEIGIIDPDLLSLSYPATITHLASMTKQITVLNKVCTASDQVYYSVQSPWTVIRLLQILFILPCPKNTQDSLSTLILNILSQHPRQYSNNRSQIHHYNILNAIFFECVNICAAKPVSEECIKIAVKFLSKNLNSTVTNFKFLALEGMLKLKEQDKGSEILKTYLGTVCNIITTDNNTSMKLQAIDVIYTICDYATLKQIVSLLISFLKTCEVSVREQLSLKISFLAGKNMNDSQWYIDNMMEMLQYGYNHIDDEIWFRVVSVIGKFESVQGYAVSKVFKFLHNPNCSEQLIKLGAYLFGEYGNLIANDTRSDPLTQYNVLVGHYSFVSTETKLIILNSMLKMGNLYPELKENIINFFKSDSISKNVDLEVQQRAFEYQHLLGKDDEFIALVCNIIPPFEESTNNGEVDMEESIISGSTKDTFDMSITKISDETNIVTKQSTYDLFGIIPASNTSQIKFDTINLVEFLYKNSGMVYEDKMCKISVQMDIVKSICSVELSIESKSMTPVIITNYEPLEHEGLIFSENTSRETLTSNNNYYTMILKAICVHEYQNLPTIKLNINSSMVSQDVTVKLTLPIYFIKFLQPYNMDIQKFVSVWRSLSQPEQEISKLINLTYNDISNLLQIKEKLLKKLKFINVSFLENIDPKPENIIATGIFNTNKASIGFIIRIEILPGVGQTKVKLTLRSTQGNFGHKILSFITDKIK